MLLALKVHARMSMSVLSLVISAHSDVTMYLVPSNVSVRMAMHWLQMEDIAAMSMSARQKQTTASTSVRTLLEHFSALVLMGSGRLGWKTSVWM